MTKFLPILIAFILSCNGGKSDHTQRSSNSQNIDTLNEKPRKEAECFLKLKQSVIKVKSDSFQNCFANVVILYQIIDSKIAGDIQVKHLCIFKNADSNIVFNSDREKLHLRSQLTNNIGETARRNLENATLHCNVDSVFSWGTIAMRIHFY